MMRITHVASGGVVPSRILVATDGSPASRLALTWADALAALSREARISVLHVVPAGMFASGPEAKEHAERVLAEARASLSTRAAETLLAYGDPPADIVEASSNFQSDLVVVGTRDRAGLERAMLGSVSEAVKNDAPCDVLVARTPPKPPCLVVAFDGSPTSLRALALGQRLSAGWGSRLHALHVRTRDGPAVDRTVLPEDVTLDDVFTPHLRLVAQAIDDRAAEVHAGLILLGSRSHGRLKRAILGSVSNELARSSRASVLVVKRA